MTPPVVAAIDHLAEELADAAAARAAAAAFLALLPERVAGCRTGARAVAHTLEGAPDPDACRAIARPYDWGALAQRMVAEMERRLAPAS